MPILRLPAQVRFGTGQDEGGVGTRKSDPTKAEDDILIVNGHEIACIMAEKELKNLPWAKLGVEYVIEATGLFSDEKAFGHLEAGARR